MKRRVFASIIAVAMLLSCMSGAFAAADTADVWDGSIDTSWYDNAAADATEYVIDSAEGLAGLAKLINDSDTGFHRFSGRTVKLACDIDLDQIDWTPIGNDEKDQATFLGIFDGQGHTISNLWIAGYEDQIGLFGRLGDFNETTPVTEIRNLTLSDVTVISNETTGHGGSYVGAVAGNGCVTKLTNVHLIGDITIQGYGYVGGLIGHGYITAENCSVKAHGEINCHYWCCGALVGYQGEGTVYPNGISDSVVASDGEGDLELWSNYGAIGGAVGLLQTASTINGVAVSNVSVDTNNPQYGIGAVSGGEAPTNCYVNNVTVTANGAPYTPDDASATIPVTAEIDGKYYETFEDALAAAVDGDVIDLLGNTHQLAEVHSKKVSGKKITVANGTLDITNGTWSGNSIIEVYSGGYLVLDHVKVVGDHYSSAFGVIYAHSNGTVEIVDSAFELSNEQYSGGGVLKGNGLTVSTFVVKDTTFALENPNRIIANATTTLDGVTINAAVTDDTLVVGDMNNHAFRNMVGTVTNSTINVSGFETGIKNTEGDLYVEENSTIVLANSKDTDLIVGAGKSLFIDETSSVDAETTDMAADAIKGKVAAIGSVTYYSLADAVAAAQNGETVDLMNNVHSVTEQILIDGKTVALENGTIDISGANRTDKTGLIHAKNAADVTITNVDFVGTDYASGYAVLQAMNDAMFTLNDCDFTLENELASNGSVLKGDDRSTYDGTFVVNGGTFTLKNTSRVVTNAIVEFDGVKINAVSDASAAAINHGFRNVSGTINDSVININGYETGMKNTDTTTLNLTGTTVMKLQDSTDTDLVLSAGTINLADTAMLYADTSDVTGGTISDSGFVSKANTIAVRFVKADVDDQGADNLEGADLYNINLVGADAETINRLNSADLTFAKSGDAVAYSITAGENITLTRKGDRYMFNFNGKDNVVDTANTITIGQVKFVGYGQYSFAVADAGTNEVHATTISDNIVDTFKPNGDLANGEGKLDLSDKSLTDIAIAVPTRTLTVNIAFPNAVVDNAANQAMTVTISGGDLATDIVYDLSGMMVNGGYTVTAEKLTKNVAYNVTVSGDGYRTAYYTVTMTDAKTLNFWNNVKDEATVVEIGEASSVATVTYLAGDIVSDNVINIYDLSAVVSYFATNVDYSAYNDYIQYDLNRDGVIDSKDVAYILASWNA